MFTWYNAFERYRNNLDFEYRKQPWRTVYLTVLLTKLPIAASVRSLQLVSIHVLKHSGYAGNTLKEHPKVLVFIFF